MFFSSLKRYALVIILIVSFILRVAWIYWLPSVIISDFAWYYERALSLLAGNGYSINGIPTAEFPPGYPFFLAIMLKIVQTTFAVKVFQAALGTFTCYLIYRLALSFTSKNTALLATAMAALYPNFIFYANLLASENIFLPLVLGGLILLIDDELNFSKPVRCVLAGIVFGLAALTRPAIILFPVLFFLYLLIQRYGIKRAFGYSSLMTMMIILLITPWTIRNFAVFNAPVTISSNGGEVFWMGNSEHSDGGRFYPPDNPLENVSGEVQRNNLAYKLAINQIKSNPLDFVETIALKYPRFFKNPDGLAWNLLDSENTDWTKEILDSPFYVRDVNGMKDKYEDYRAMQATLEYFLWIGAALGSLLLWKNKRSMLLLAFMIYWFMFHMVFAFGHPRFVMPVVPINIMLTAAFLTYLPGWLLSKPKAIAEQPMRHLLASVLSFFVLFWIMLWWPNMAQTDLGVYYRLEILVGTLFAIMTLVAFTLMLAQGRRLIPEPVSRRLKPVIKYLEPLWQPQPGYSNQ